MKDDPDFMRRISLDLAARKAACRILNVEEDADLEQLKRAYRIAAIRHHPDHNGDTAEANRMFALIKCAYDLLAFDKPCNKLLAEIDSWPGVPEDDKYKLDNPWGHFCWWREKFFGP
jgi:hypothetical protein